MRRTNSPILNSPIHALLLALALALALTGAPATAADLLALLRDGRAVALIRHAHAPGVGDPAGMRLEDCATQRNLDDAGQREAAALGDRLRAAGITELRLFTSRWCRCRDTAALLRLGTPAPQPILDSFFAAPARAETQTDALRAFLAGLGSGPPVVLVTHQVNITALTRINPAPAEIVLVARDAPHGVLGRLR